MSTKKVTWYEKTVEYAFVRKFLEAAAMPLSGTAEKVGDTIFYEGNSFFIIEFKRGLNLGEERKSERNKYSDIEKTINKLQEHPASKSHFVVWGYVDKELNFALRAQKYFAFIDEKLGSDSPYKPWELDIYPLKSTSPCELILLNLSFIPLNNLEQLKTYLQLLIDEKKSSSNDSSSVDYGNTLIVDKHGTACALSDRGGLEELGLEFPTNKPSSDYSSSYGMQ